MAIENCMYRTLGRQCQLRIVGVDAVSQFRSFMDYDMAYFDMESSRVQALENPFGPKVLGM
jgi:hypothetical protein